MPSATTEWFNCRAMVKMVPAITFGEGDAGADQDRAVGVMNILGKPHSDLDLIQAHILCSVRGN